MTPVVALIAANLGVVALGYAARCNANTTMTQNIDTTATYSTHTTREREGLRW